MTKKILGAITGSVFLVLLAAQGAQADAITDAMTATGTQVSGYGVAGVAIVVAALAVGVGVRVLIKYARRAAGAV